MLEITNYSVGWINSIYLPSFFFFQPTPPPGIYTLSLHDALPIFRGMRFFSATVQRAARLDCGSRRQRGRSEEHTSELQSRPHLVCRLLLEKKNGGTLVVRAAGGHCPVYQSLGITTNRRSRSRCAS